MTDRKQIQDVVTRTRRRRAMVRETSILETMSVAELTLMMRELDRVEDLEGTD